MRIAADLMIVTGLASLLAGLGMIYVPLPLIVGGLALMLGGTRLEAYRGNARPPVRDESDRT